MSRLTRVVAVGLAAVIGPLSLGPSPERGSFWSGEQFFAIVLPLMCVSAVLAGLAPRLALSAVIGAVVGALAAETLGLERDQKGWGVRAGLAVGGLLGSLYCYVIDQQREKKKGWRTAAGKESVREAAPLDDPKTDSGGKAVVSDARYAFWLMMLSIGIGTLFGLSALTISWLAGFACLLFGTLVGVILVFGFLAPLALRKFRDAVRARLRNQGRGHEWRR